MSVGQVVRVVEVKLVVVSLEVKRASGLPRNLSFPILITREIA